MVDAPKVDHSARDTHSKEDDPKNHTHHQVSTTTLMERLQQGPAASEFARTYNDRTGGCNIHLATHLISLIKPHLPPPSSPLRTLDNACGPLVLTNEILHDDDIKTHPTVHISAIDINEVFIKNNQDHIDAAGPRERVKIDTAVMNGMDLHFSDNTFDVSFTSLAIFAFPDPVKGARELQRTLKPGGVAALTTWKRVGWMALLHEVERLIKPEKELTQFPFLEPWSVPGKLRQTLVEGGFRDVVEEEVVSHAWFESEEMAAGMVIDTLGMLVGEKIGEEEKEELREGFRRVMGDKRESLVRGEGGKVGFEMVAWTGVGRK